MTTATTNLTAKSAEPANPGLWLAALTLWKREMVRFFRQRNRVVGAFATPIVFWLLLGSGLRSSFVMPGETQRSDYLLYFFPGTVVLILMFTAIFSTISVIEDRREGFLQAVLVAPIPRLAIVLGKVLGGASIAVIQGVMFLIFWPIIGAWPGLGWMLGSIGVMAVLSIGLTALGLLLAWPMDSTAGFHAIMNLLLMPMWFLSGAVFPLDSAPHWLRVVMVVNPLTYGQRAFSRTLAGETAWMDLGITIIMTTAAIALAAALVSRPRKDGT
jgi:ABC-2 type transport system permease protein